MEDGPGYFSQKPGPAVTKAKEHVQFKPTTVEMNCDPQDLRSSQGGIVFSYFRVFVYALKVKSNSAEKETGVEDLEA
jgi:hypothetical protein